MGEETKKKKKMRLKVYFSQINSTRISMWKCFTWLLFMTIMYANFLSLKIILRILIG